MLRPSALGQTDLCSLIPTSYIPILRDVVAKVGCNPASRAYASAAITQALSEPGATPGAPSQVPAYAPFIATLGPAVIADCICKQSGMPQGGPQVPYYPPPQPWYSNPLVVGGIVLGAAALVFALRPKPAEPAAR